MDKEKNQKNLEEKHSEIKVYVMILFVFSIMIILFLGFMVYQIYTLKNDLEEKLNLFKIEAKNKFNSLKGSINKNKEKLIDLESNFGDLENSVDNIENKINKNRDELNSIKYELVNEHDKIIELNNSLHKLNLSVNKTFRELSYNLSLLREELYNKYNVVKTTLEELNKLRNKINDLNTEIESKISQIYELNSQISKLEEDINLLNEKIKNKLIWIGMNSKIDSSNPIIEKIKNNCVEYSTSLNLACVWYFLHEIYGIHYIYDNNDQLASINETLNKKGGDCEDLSFLFAAVVRSIPHENVKYLVDSVGSKAIVYDDGVYVYYIPNVSYKEAVGYNKIYVACGLDEEGTAGHCLNVICNTEFDKKISIKNFVYSHCIIIEPQQYAHISLLKNLCFLITDKDICADNNGKNFCLSDMLLE